MMHRSKSLLLIALPALCCTAWPWRTHAGPIDPPPPATTIDVTRVLGAGMAKVTVFFGENTVPVVLDIGANDMPADVAAAIARRFVGATSNGSTVTIPRASGALFVSPRVSINGMIVNQQIRINLDSEGWAALPGVPAAIVAFGPDPITGGTTLVDETSVRAGFAHGLTPASFSASAGTNIATLTSTLNTDLDLNGYITKLLGADAIEVFANGAGTPTEFDLALNDLGSGGLGISEELLLPAPEPSSWLVLAPSLLGLVGAKGLRRWRLSSPAGVSSGT
jgi:hypothetical protein